MYLMYSILRHDFDQSNTVFTQCADHYLKDDVVY